MPPTIVRVVVVLALVVMAVAAAYVETLGLRVALVVVPALFLTYRALAMPMPAPVAEPVDSLDEDRRSDPTVRQHIKQLLDVIRDFYSTCHMVAVGQLSPAKAKSKARDVEEKLNEMMRDMLDRLEGEEDPSLRKDPTLRGERGVEGGDDGSVD